MIERHGSGGPWEAVVGYSRVVKAGPLSRWKELGRAHGEIFADIRPVTAMYGVSGLLDPRMLVEIEATAYLPDC